MHRPQEDLPLGADEEEQGPQREAQGCLQRTGKTRSSCLNRGPHLCPVVRPAEGATRRRSVGQGRGCQCRHGGAGLGLVRERQTTSGGGGGDDLSLRGDHQVRRVAAEGGVFEHQRDEAHAGFGQRMQETSRE